MKDDTMKRKAAILAALARGHTRVAASSAGEIVLATFKQWRNEDPRFRAAVRAAEREGMLRLLRAARLLPPARTERDAETKTTRKSRNPQENRS